MIKKLVLVFVAFITIQSYAQQGTASPYSFYGIGSLKFKGTVENRSMGRLSIYNDSIHINLRNPASYASENLSSPRFNGESRPVKYTIGGGFANLNLKSESSSAKASSATFNYLALSIPVGRFGVGFSILPQTAVGYKLENLSTDGIALLESIAKKKGFPLKNHGIDLERAAITLLNDYRQGLLGRISLETPESRMLMMSRQTTIGEDNPSQDKET